MRPVIQKVFRFLLLLACVAGSGALVHRASSAVSFIPSGGVFTNPVSLKLSSTDAGEIRYTLDGSEPRLESTIYSAPIAVSNSVLIRAKVFGTGGNSSNQSETVSQPYLFVDSELAGFDSNLPLMLISSYGEELDKDTKTFATARVVNGGNKRSSLFGAAEFNGRVVMNIRGRASLRYPKRSYTLRTIDEDDSYKKVSLLGLPADSDWVLYAPYPDKTFIRDVLAYELSNQMGHYASRTKFVEVFVNESTNRLNKMTYMGVYVLEEKIRRGKDRVDVEKLGPEDNSEPKITGGYIFKKDHGSEGGEWREVNLGGFPGGTSSSSSNRFGYPTGPGGFPADRAGFLPPYTGPNRESSSSSSSSSRKTTSTVNVTNRMGLLIEDTDELSNYRFSTSSSISSKRERFTTKSHTNEFYYVYPEPDEITAAQRAWLMNELNKCEAAIYGKNFLDPTNGYKAYIDPTSFIDHHILVEMSKNADGFRFSTFFHKERGGKIKMGPIWDWNLSFGNVNGKQGWISEYWLWPQLTDKEYSWFRRLFDDPDFGQQYVDRWAQLRTNIFATSNIIARVDYYTNLLNEAQARNYERWPILGRQVWPQQTWGNTYGEEVQFMKDWIVKRLAWIDGQFLGTPAVTSTNSQVTLNAGKGEVYYTLDGSDPRGIGGKPAAKAAKYTIPVPTAANSVLFARAYVDNRWSAPLVRKF
jgi:hypothetical protein